MLVDAPTVQPLPTDDAALIRHFEKTDPESLALARDWTDTTHELSRTQKHIKACVSFRSGGGPADLVVVWNWKAPMV